MCVSNGNGMFGIIFFCRHSVGGERVLTVACIACATERSLTELEYDDSVDTLDEHLHTHGMKRVEVPPDGHCIIHSWRMGLAAQGAKMEQEQILKLGVAEISENLGFYGEFLPDEDLKCQLEAYALLNNYQSTVVDLMVYALASATHTTCILFSARDGKLRTTRIEPRQGIESNHTIHVCKFGPHYDAVLDMSTPVEGR